MLFEKHGADCGSLTEVKYLCVCNACKRVYAYKASDGSSFGDMQFATDYNNGITYVMNALSMRVESGRQFRVHGGSGRAQKRVTRGQLCSDMAVCCGTPVQESDWALDAPPRSAVSTSRLVQLFARFTLVTNRQHFYTFPYLQTPKILGNGDN